MKRLIALSLLCTLSTSFAHRGHFNIKERFNNVEELTQVFSSSSENLINLATNINVKPESSSGISSSVVKNVDYYALTSLTEGVFANVYVYVCYTPDGKINKIVPKVVLAKNFTYKDGVIVDKDNNILARFIYEPAKRYKKYRVINLLGFRWVIPYYVYEPAHLDIELSPSVIAYNQGIVRSTKDVDSKESSVLTNDAFIIENLKNDVNDLLSTLDTYKSIYDTLRQIQEIKDEIKKKQSELDKLKRKLKEVSTQREMFVDISGMKCFYCASFSFRNSGDIIGSPTSIDGTNAYICFAQNKYMTTDFQYIGDFGSKKIYSFLSGTTLVRIDVNNLIKNKKLSGETDTISYSAEFSPQAPEYRYPKDYKNLFTIRYYISRKGSPTFRSNISFSAVCRYLDNPSSINPSEVNSEIQKLENEIKELQNKLNTYIDSLKKALDTDSINTIKTLNDKIRQEVESLTLTSIKNSYNQKNVYSNVNDVYVFLLRCAQNINNIDAIMQIFNTYQNSIDTAERSLKDFLRDLENAKVSTSVTLDDKSNYCTMYEVKLAKKNAILTIPDMYLVYPSVKISSMK